MICPEGNCAFDKLCCCKDCDKETCDETCLDIADCEHLTNKETP